MYHEICITFESLGWRKLCSVIHVPMENGGVCYERNSVCTDPFPIGDIFAHCGRFQFLLLRKVEDLKCPRLGLECNDQPTPVHNGTICLDRPPSDIIVVLQIDDDNVGVARIRRILLPHTHIMIGLKCLLCMRKG